MFIKDYFLQIVMIPITKKISTKKCVERRTIIVISYNT